jgi:uncharacterized protein YjiK
MLNRWPAVALAAVVVLSSACKPTPEAAAAQAKAISAKRTKDLAKRLAVADKDPKKVKPVAEWIMPVELREISGIALLPNGQLLAHGDEQALITVLDPKSGLIVERFQLKGTVHGDFEGITVAGDDIWLLESNGRLFQFRRGPNKSHVPYAVRDTKLGKECEFEGITYEPDSTRLVMACKRVTQKKAGKQLLLYRLPLAGPNAGTISSLSVPMDEVVGSTGWKGFQPSDITIDPNNGNYVIIASQEKGIVVLTPDGEVVRSEKLPGKHPQAEGIAITPDNILIISDEATNKPAAITLYRWRP